MKKIYQYGILSGFLALYACGNNSDNMDASGTFEATEVIVSAEANGKRTARYRRRVYRNCPTKIRLYRYGTVISAKRATIKEYPFCRK
mgnify:CR=1 FL=1